MNIYNKDLNAAAAVQHIDVLFLYLFESDSTDCHRTTGSLQTYLGKWNYNCPQCQSTWFPRHCTLSSGICSSQISDAWTVSTWVCYLPLSCHGRCAVSHNPLSSLDPSDCGCPSGKGPSADYHEAADWIVFLVPGGWSLQEHPNTGVWLSSTGQTSVTYESNSCCNYAPDPARASCVVQNMTQLYVITAWIRFFRNSTSFLSWRSVNQKHRCDFLLTDNEVLRAEDPHTQWVLRSLWRAARLSKWIHVEGNEKDEWIGILH